MINTNRLKAKIVEHGLTQLEVAKLLDISQATLSLKLNNARPMDLDEAEKLSEILGIMPEEFCSYFFT